MTANFRRRVDPRQLSDTLSDTLTENLDDIKESVSHGTGKILAVMVLLYLLAMFVLAWYWSREPDLFSVHSPRSTVGITTTETLLRVTQSILDKNGGYTANDILPPGVWMDDMPNWEYGVLVQVRDFSRAIKEVIGRAPNQLRDDNDLAVASSRFDFDHQSWVLPASEAQYREGIEHLQAYQQRLENGGEDGAVFINSAANLDDWLARVQLRLDSLSQRLSASVGPRLSNAGVIKTPTLKVDDVFYEARGTTWALIHLLKAVEIDFADELKQKKANELLQQIILELEETQQPVRSPMILNGSGFGVLTNHSLVMASYIARIDAELIELRLLLQKPAVLENESVR